jgi:hypothetical protein
MVLMIEPLAKRPFRSTSTLCLKFYPRNIDYMPAVKFFACLDFERKASFCKGSIENTNTPFLTNSNIKKSSILVF